MDNRVVGMLIRHMVDGVRMLRRSSRPSGAGYWSKNRMYRRGDFETAGRCKLTQDSRVKKRMRFAKRLGLTDVTRTGMRALPH